MDNNDEIVENDLQQTRNDYRTATRSLVLFRLMSKGDRERYIRKFQLKLESDVINLGGVQVENVAKLVELMCVEPAEVMFLHYHHNLSWVEACVLAQNGIDINRLRELMRD